MSWKPTSLSASSTCERDKVQGTSGRRAPCSGKLGCTFPELSKGIYVIYAQSRTPQEIWITHSAEGSDLRGQTWEKFNLQRKKKNARTGSSPDSRISEDRVPGFDLEPFSAGASVPWRLLRPRDTLAVAFSLPSGTLAGRPHCPLPRRTEEAEARESGAVPRGGPAPEGSGSLAFVLRRTAHHHPYSETLWRGTSCPRPLPFLPTSTGIDLLHPPASRSHPKDGLATSILSPHATPPPPRLRGQLLLNTGHAAAPLGGDPGLSAFSAPAPRQVEPFIPAPQEPCFVPS